MSAIASKIVFFCLILIASYQSLSEPAPVQLAKSYSADIKLADYWVSEKLDGVRAYWNGQQLLTRKGHVIKTPDWFVKSFPDLPMDGELWIGRSQFQSVVSVVKKHQPVDAEWRQVRYMLFDLPGQTGTFDERIIELKRLVAKLGQPWLQMIPQRKLASTEALDELLRQIEAKQGEGLMLHLGSALHASGRSSALLKLKSYQDAEARVVAYSPGKGKYKGLVGALIVENEQGLQFNLGSGLSDDDRLNPPAIGGVVSYKFNGYTQRGIPRFARYWRERQ